MSPRAALLVMMQAAPEFEEEFNAWYDTEHVPERLAVPGIRSAHRFVAETGWPRYLALYDLDDVAVLDTPEYRRVSGDRNSPWTRRVLSRVTVERVVCRQVAPGGAAVVPAPRVLLVRFRGIAAAAASGVADGLERLHRGRAGVRQSRIFADHERPDDRTDLYAVTASIEPLLAVFDTAEFGEAATMIDRVNAYVACNRPA